jgi:hypothetical protein
MPFNPELAALYGRIGAHMAHAKHGGEHMTSKARESFMARFEREADPEGILPAEERARRAEHLKRAYFSRLALKRAEKRKEAA